MKEALRGYVGVVRPFRSEQALFERRQIVPVWRIRHSDEPSLGAVPMLLFSDSQIPLLHKLEEMQFQQLLDTTAQMSDPVGVKGVSIGIFWGSGRELADSGMMHAIDQPQRRRNGSSDRARGAADARQWASAHR